MVLENPRTEVNRSTPWPWRIGLVVETPGLASEILSALAESNAPCVFHSMASAPPFEVAHMVEREKPELLFVEFSYAPGVPAEWINIVRSGREAPLVVAVHSSADPDEMISALRAGATEFLYLPVRPAIFEAMDRVAALLESRQLATLEQGRIAGILSAKGGCGATTLACFLAAALHTVSGSGRVLIADLDHQSPSAHIVCRAPAGGKLEAAFESVRRLNSGCWNDFAASLDAGVDLIGRSEKQAESPPEPWRIDSLFRFVMRHYRWTLADLGRHLNPTNWAFLQNVDQLFVVTAPDVLALFQTRSILQTLSSRGFDRNRVRLILNRNQSSPQDFWVESIEKMFEMSVYAVVPNDAALASRPAGRFEYPADSSFGRAVMKLAHKMDKTPPDNCQRKAA